MQFSLSSVKQSFAPTATALSAMIYEQVDVKHVSATINQVGVIANVDLGPKNRDQGVHYISCWNILIFSHDISSLLVFSCVMTFYGEILAKIILIGLKMFKNLLIPIVS